MVSALKPFALEAAFFQHARRGFIEFEYLSGDPNQVPLTLGECTGRTDDVGHDSLAPIGPREPIADLGAVAFDQLIEPKSPNQLSIGGSDREMDGVAIFRRRRSSDCDESLGVNTRIGERNSQGSNRR